MAENRRTFHSLLREARIAAEQTPEVMAVLLNMTEEEYLALESQTYPDDELLRRLCLINEWNYYDTQRLIINEMIAPRSKSRTADGTAESDSVTGPSMNRPTPTTNANTLGERLRDVRMVTGQSTEIIAMLLGIKPEDYQNLENGGVPGDDLLRRISMIYNWNYQDLLSILRSQDARSFQPSRVGMPFLGSSAQSARLRGVLRELEALFVTQPEKDQIFLLAQLELIRDTMQRKQPGTPKAVTAGKSEPAPTPGKIGPNQVKRVEPKPSNEKITSQGTVPAPGEPRPTGGTFA